MIQTVGFIGVGHFAEFLVAGLRRCDRAPAIVLSPRNRQRASTLAAAHGARVAADNAEVVRRSDLIILATRPDQAMVAVRDLPWREGQHLISVAAGLDLEHLQAVVSPARAALAMPISSAAIGESPTLLFPAGGPAEVFLARFGSVHALPDAESFRAACVMGAYYAWLYAIMTETATWMSQRGVPPATARDIAARTLRAAGNMVLERGDQPLAEMLSRLATPGGITEAGLKQFAEGAVWEHWARACDAAHDKMRGLSEPPNA